MKFFGNHTFRFIGRLFLGVVVLCEIAIVTRFFSVRVQAAYCNYKCEGSDYVGRTSSGAECDRFRNNSRCKTADAPQPTVKSQQQQQQAGCSNRSCPGNECNDGTKYGPDPCTPQASCQDRDNEACRGHGGPKGSSAQAQQAATGGSCPAGSSNGCAGRNPGDVFHVEGTCLKCVTIGNRCGRDEVSCPADLSTIPAVTTGESGYGPLPDPSTSSGGTCNGNSWSGCVGKNNGLMLVSDSQNGVCQQCVDEGKGACTRLYVTCPGAKKVASNGACSAGSADGCYSQKPGYVFESGGVTFTCTRSGETGACGRVIGKQATQSQAPVQNTKTATQQAVSLPPNSGNKVDYCFAHSMVYVGGCVDKCLPETKTAIQWTTELCGYTEQQQQDIANKLKGKDRDAELAALQRKKKEVEQAASTQNTLDTYYTGPQAARNCKNRAGTFIDCGSDGSTCYGETDVTSGQKAAECAKLHDRIQSAKGTGKNWLDNLMTTGGDGQECKRDSDCVSNLCRGYLHRFPNDIARSCVSYSDAKAGAEISMDAECKKSGGTMGTCGDVIKTSVCIPAGGDKKAECDTLTKRIKAAEDKGLNSFDWQKTMIDNGYPCSDSALCKSNICNTLPSDVGKPDAKAVCLTPDQLTQRNKTVAAPVGMNLSPGTECLVGQCGADSVCDTSKSTKVTSQNQVIGTCAITASSDCGTDFNSVSECENKMVKDLKRKGYTCDAFTKKNKVVCWHPVAPPEAAQSLCGIDDAIESDCNKKRDFTPTGASGDSVVTCEKYTSTVDSKTDCWKLKSAPAPLPDLCKHANLSCGGLAHCETVDRKHVRCSGWFIFQPGGNVTVLNYSEICTENSCRCMSRDVGKNEICTPTTSECLWPKVIFNNQCLDPSSLPQPQKANDTCFQIDGAPRCPTGTTCLKKAGATSSTCVNTGASSLEFTLGDECPTVGQQCAGGGAEPSVCQQDPKNSQRNVCVTMTTTEKCSLAGRFPTKDDCLSQYSNAVSSGNAECAQGADQCWTINQLVLSPGKTCKYQRCQCNSKVEKVGDTLSFGWINQNEVCHGKKQEATIGQSTSDTTPIAKDKLCNYLHCSRLGTWCEVVDVESQTARCVWGIGGSGKGNSAQILQPGSACLTNECGCTVLTVNIHTGDICQGSSNGSVCYNPGQFCGQDKQTICKEGFCRPK